MEKVVFVKCCFSPGGFPTEHTFRIDTPAGVLYGAAPVRYCLTPARRPLADIPAEGVEGLVVGLQIGSRPAGDLARVYLPDGEMYDLAEEQIEYHPAEVPSRVPVGS